MDADAPLFKEPLFGELIITELSSYESLKSILEQERELLVNRDFDAFTLLLGQKHELLTKLEQDNQTRCQLLQQQQLPISKDGVETLISKLPAEDGETAKENWESLNHLIDECAQMNEINARITHRAQSSSQQILNLLRGESAGFELYGNKGKSKPRTGALPITKV